VLDEDLAVVDEADAFLRHVRFGRDGSELTTRSYAGGIALFLRWLHRRHWHDGVAALGCSSRIAARRPQASGVDVWWVAGAGGSGREPVREARRINGVLTAVRGFVAHAVTSGQALGELMGLIYELADERDLPAQPWWGAPDGLAMGALHEPEATVDRASDEEIGAAAGLSVGPGSADRAVDGEGQPRRGELCGWALGHLLADRVLGCVMPRRTCMVRRQSERGGPSPSPAGGAADFLVAQVLTSTSSAPCGAAGGSRISCWSTCFGNRSGR
jgi:hypothetical protein